ncbi:response regulator [Tunturibacter empetritectus]|uniref:DNA-binding NtrC family response regulator n=1 Tax=Tunturiibacter lichenicola TaxID=2051959 RepID=A0A7W8N6K2_9BACT|nr:response regulator [Edaphobacter lichenicola]MBB5345095.1 DNA-binding NtrC family response regulator [Edaphobacter lichenicola]
MLGSQKPKVLIVDDERVITDTLVTIFSNSGYEARGGYSAEEAVAIVESAEWCPQLAIIDVCLPGMNGIDLAVLFRALCPDCHIALFSGQAATGQMLEQAQQDGHSFEIFAKPVHPTELLGVASNKLSPLIADRKDQPASTDPMPQTSC